MEEITEAFNTWQYAMQNNIKPHDPTTWDDEYRKKQQRLAGISNSVEKQIKQFTEWLDSASESQKG
jgi:hypothetical protein